MFLVHMVMVLVGVVCMALAGKVMVLVGVDCTALAHMVMVLVGVVRTVLAHMARVLVVVWGPFYNNFHLYSHNWGDSHCYHNTELQYRCNLYENEFNFLINYIL